MQQTVTERLTNLVTDPLFWIVTVFIAMIVSIFANYATRGTDRVFIYTLFIILEPLPEMIIAPLGVFGFLSTIIFAWYLRLFLRHSRRERRDWLTNLIYC